MFFVCTSKYNVSPAFVMDIIYRMLKVFRDYTGVLSEESIRKNFVLVYEVIDELLVSEDHSSNRIMVTLS